MGIVERLRAWSECSVFPEQAQYVISEAVCEITRLTAEVEDLSNRLHHVHRLWANNEHALRAENATLTARVKELEGAFLKVTDALNKGRIVPRRVVSGVGIEILYEYTDVPVGPIEDAIEILYEDRAALTQPAEKGGE